MGPLLGRNGTAISADRLTVGGNLRAADLEADGSVELSGARIAGNLDFSGAQVRAPGGQAVAAERIVVGDQLNFNGFRSEGQVMLRGGRIDGQVLFSGAHLANPGRYVLHASALTVGDSLYLWHDFSADGEIVLPPGPRQRRGERRNLRSGHHGRQHPHGGHVPVAGRRPGRLQQLSLSMDWCKAPLCAAQVGSLGKRGHSV